MADGIKIFDTTLRDGEQSPGCSLNLGEKLEVARQLERLKVDVIEAGFAAASPGSFEEIRAIAAEIKDAGVAALARTRTGDIDAAAGAVKDAARPRVHTFIATSPIHMQFKLKMTPDEVLSTTREMVKYARNLCPEVEFSAEDATRSDPEFLCRVFEAAIDAGAAVINVPDTVGYTTPEEFSDLIRHLKSRIPNADKALVSVHCHNDLGMAVANTLTAARAGASQLECTVNGIGERAGNAALEEVVMALHTRRDRFGRGCRVDTKQIFRTSRLVSSLIGVPVPPNKAVVGGNAFAHESGIHQHGVLAKEITYEIMTPESVGLLENQIVLGKHSGRHAFEERLQRLGYSLRKEDLDETFALFKNLADKKKKISDWDIEALVMKKYGNSPEVFRLERFIINSGNTITATANIKLGWNGQSREEVAHGDGPIDAAFKAIEKIVGGRYVLEDFSLRSVTAGNDAQAGVLLKLRSGERVVVGKGLSTDVVEAGILAFLNAVNRLLEAKNSAGS
ncbi:MAG: 2-isopropylmalate synthase [Candidatus Aminicenantes bacterium RBG_16_63_16]|nr:MAG: 2-isopropylmalate synthase [Candidatus Aminicenantes bacterium RBG_16_63_16]